MRRSGWARRQAYASASTAASRSSAMLRPVTTTTSGARRRGSTRPAITAGDRQPRRRPRRRSRARARGSGSPSSISGSETATTAATWSRTSGNVTEPGSMLPASPSASVSPTSIGVIAPAASALENAGRALGLDARRRALRAAPPPRGPRPDARLPPPSGADDRRSGPAAGRRARARASTAPRSRPCRCRRRRRSRRAPRARARAPPPRRSPRRAGSELDRQRPQRGDLGRRGRLRHHDRGMHAQRGRRPGDARPALPAEAVTTGPPPARRSAASAPRTLNEPVGCSVSSFRHTSSPSAGAGTSGVGASRVGDDRARAASSSAAVGGAATRAAITRSRLRAARPRRSSTARRDDLRLGQPAEEAVDRRRRSGAA